MKTKSFINRKIKHKMLLHVDRSSSTLVCNLDGDRETRVSAFVGEQPLAREVSSIQAHNLDACRSQLRKQSAAVASDKN